MDARPARELAHHLGRALQLTNILRDLDEDAAWAGSICPTSTCARPGSRHRTRDAVIAAPRVEPRLPTGSPPWPTSTSAAAPERSSPPARAGHLIAPRLMAAVYAAMLERLRAPRAGRRRAAACSVAQGARCVVAAALPARADRMHGLCRRRRAGRTLRRRRAGRARAVQGGRLEAAAQAGGRCRSYFDPQLGLTIDNGNHLVLSGNRAVARLPGAAIGAQDRLAGPAEAAFPFVDLRTGARWTIRPNPAPIAWWVLVPGRGVPGARLRRLSGARAAAAGPAWAAGREVIACAGPALGAAARSPSCWRRSTSSPQRGRGRTGQPRDPADPGPRRGGLRARASPSPTLAAAFVDPALRFLAAARRARAHPAPARAPAHRRRPRGRARVHATARSRWARDDAVVLAVPPWVAAGLGARAHGARRLRRHRQRATSASRRRRARRC